ncbi:hypothetical protein F0919_11130 [Taibaiella lutea]|uniref:Uncharacterized protein n=1 Tax=Taibaiella lutea TaxID=2608001 RepID=A0A5M6CPH7_9BACT|nr:hypothetical protein [Taibaiella lutea]KAA5535135.1 hypothetical protein F0919_11130 [Taibaiella lutea]
MKANHTSAEYYKNNNKTITKLITLWALSESGLGGLMFALHIPLTGIFVGGFAVVIITLIAFYSENKFSQLVKATIIVLIVKATVSPHAPPPAYLAVAFQGFLGAALFGLFSYRKWVIYILAVLAMLESACQKLIMLTLVYGNSIWIALDKMLSGLFEEFSLPETIHYSYWIIAIYLFIYIIWAFVIARFAAGLPKYFQQNASQILNDFQLNYNTQTQEKEAFKSKKRKRIILWFVITLAFVLFVFWWNDWYNSSKLLSIAIRSIAAVLLLYYVLRPVLEWAIKKWLQSRNPSLKKEAVDIIEAMPTLRNYVRPCWQMAQSQGGKWKQMRYFVRALLIVTIYE